MNPAVDDITRAKDFLASHCSPHEPQSCLFTDTGAVLIYDSSTGEILRYAESRSLQKLGQELLIARGVTGPGEVFEEWLTSFSLEGVPVDTWRAFFAARKEFQGEPSRLLDFSLSYMGDDSGLEGVVFRYCDFAGSVFGNTDLRGCRFEHCNFTPCEFHGAIADSETFGEGCQLPSKVERVPYPDGAPGDYEISMKLLRR